MYNQWTFQQVAAIQYALQFQQQQQQQQLQQQHHHQYMIPQTMSATNSPVINQDDDIDEDDDTKRTLFCANLDERVNEELLYEVFLQAGPLESVRIPKDNTGRQRTFGFVTYVHSCSAPYAMHLFQGLTLFRKQLTIKYQHSSSAPPTPQHYQDHRSQSGNDSEAKRRRSCGQSRSSYENSSLRGSNFAAFNHEQSPSVKTSHDEQSPPANPFRRELDSAENPFKRGERLEWTKGGPAKEHLSKQTSAQLWPRQNTAPYKRHSSGGERETHARNRDQHGNEYQRRHHNAGSNRQSDQRQSSNDNKSKTRR